MIFAKRIIVTLVVSAIIWNSGGYYIFFRTLQAGIRAEMKSEAENICENDLVRIELKDGDISGISWLKKDKEFIYKGEFYDIVKIKRSVNSNIYLCIRDIKEKKLVENYNATSRKDNCLDLITEIIFKLLNPLTINQLSGELAFFLPGYHIFGNHNYILSKGFAPILVPPPRKLLL